MSAALKSRLMTAQTERLIAERARALTALVLILAFNKEVEGLNFDVPPTLPANASKLWLVDGKVVPLPPKARIIILISYHGRSGLEFLMLMKPSMII